MKKMMQLAALALVGLTHSGCAYVLKDNNAGFPAVCPGILYCDMKVAQQVTPPTLPAHYKMLGPVSAEATTTNVLFIFSTGDASYETLKRAALSKYPDAKAIINLEIDCDQHNYFVVNRVTAKIRGIAVSW